MSVNNLYIQVKLTLTHYLVVIHGACDEIINQVFQLLMQFREIFLTVANVRIIHMEQYVA
jgi:hypothetical protein